MDNGLAWAGWFVSIVALVANLYQWHTQHLSKGTMDLHRDQLFAIKTSLIQLRAALQEAHDQLPLFKSANASVWLGTIGHKDKMIEHQADIMLGLTRLPMKRAHWLKRFWAKLFPLAVRDEVDLASWDERKRGLAEEVGPAEPAQPIATTHRGRLTDKKV